MLFVKRLKMLKFTVNGSAMVNKKNRNVRNKELRIKKSKKQEKSKIAHKKTVIVTSPYLQAQLCFLSNSVYPVRVTNSTSSAATDPAVTRVGAFSEAVKNCELRRYRSAKD